MFETWEIVGKAMGTHQIAFDFFTLISVTCVCPQNRQLWFTHFFSLRTLMLLDGLQQKGKYTQGQQRGVGDLGLQNIFTKLKMSHRLTQVPTISNVFEFDLKWKK
jgi:hypothetical protein